MNRKVFFVVLFLSILLFWGVMVGAVKLFIRGSYFDDNAVLQATLNGTTADDYFGWSVGSGDVNNDSYADIIVGAYLADPSGAGDAGQVYVFFGTANGISDMDSTNANITLNGTKSGDNLGISVGSGDVNNDSYADIIAGAYSADPLGAASAGQVYVFFGADYPDTAGISYNSTEDANLTFNGTTAGDLFGEPVGSGDVNNDSYADIIVGAVDVDFPGADNAGQVYVFFGADYPDTAGISYNSTEDANLTFNGTTASDFFGYSVGSGDVNNDSYADLIVGAQGADPSDVGGAGQVYVFFGADYPDTAGISYNALIDANITLNGTITGDLLGRSVGSGDVNNDSYADIIAGAYRAAPSGTTDAGQAYVFFGADYPDTAGISYNSTEDANLTFNGTTAGDYFGWSVGSGDVNNDSYADIIAGAYFADPSGSTSGQVYVFFGADYPDTAGISYNALIDANITLNGTTASDYFGYSVGSGDVNNDSYADIIVGAYFADPLGASNAGQVYILEYAHYPVITLDNPVNLFNETASGFVQFNYTVTDTDDVVDTCELWGNWTGSWHLNESIISPPMSETNGSSNISIEDGRYIWTVYCNDTANFYRNNVPTRTLTVDTSGPVVSLEYPVDFYNETGSGFVQFNYSANDSLDGMDTCELWGNWTADGWHLNETFVGIGDVGTGYGQGNLKYDGSEVNASTNVSIEDGRYVWSVYCNDTWGHSNTTVENYTLTVDLTAPVVNLDSPVDFANFSIALDFNYTASDVPSGLDTCELWGNWTTGWHLNETFINPTENSANGSSVITIEDGRYVWNVLCNDTVGNSGFNDTNYTLTIDATEPLVLIDNPTEGTTYSTSTIDFNYTIIDALGNLDSVWYTNDSGVTNITLTSNITFTSLPNAGYTLTLYANDTLNNLNETNVTFTVSVSGETPPSGGGG